MRIWSLHPAHLDRQGLIACWRETLLAQKVLAGETTGYRHHPQLVRFRQVDDPLAAIGAYLAGLAAEADARGYRFDRTRIRALPAGMAHGTSAAAGTNGADGASAADGASTADGTGAADRPGAAAWTAVIPVSTGQLEYEASHLLAKLVNRSPEVAETFAAAQAAGALRTHPVFRLGPGPIADWEVR